MIKAIKRRVNRPRIRHERENRVEEVGIVGKRGGFRDIWNFLRHVWATCVGTFRGPMAELTANLLVRFCQGRGSDSARTAVCHKERGRYPSPALDSDFLLTSLH